MIQTLLSSPADLSWLETTHKVPATQYAVAVIHGNEDSPYRVELFAQDDYRCRPVIFEFNPETETLEKA